MGLRHSRRSSKLALVLAGGGITGAVYEIGALRAIDDLLVDRTVNDFDMYIGTSAGAIVASFLSNGLTADEMYQVIDGTHPTIRPVAREHIFSFNQGEFFRRMAGMPKHLALAWYTSLRHLNEVTLIDILWSLSDALPSGLYDGMALERYMRSVLTMPGRSNCFSDLGNRLHVIATNLNTGERAVFGDQHCADVPISLAVAASSAVPMLYKPVCIRDQEYIDGGMRGTASIDLAIEQGATLVVCVNPLVPHNSSGELEAGRAENLSARGVPAIASQVTRITSHAGLRYQIKQLRRQHPEVDIILIEPHPTDQRMFYGNIMHYQARLEVARHGFESVTLDLAEDYLSYKETLARHGVPITRRLVIEELAEIRNSDFDPVVIRQVLEARSRPCARHRRNSPFCQLQQTLAQLELELDSVEMT